MSKVRSANLGYPRIGENREWKKALEKYWNGSLSKEELLAETEQLRLQFLQKQKKSGIDFIPVGDFSLYDHVLDTSVMFGIVPKRFTYNRGPVPLETYFAIARGTEGAVASEMTKWFNTNYHYIVPELEDAVPTLTENRPLAYYLEAKEKLGIDGKPVILGPITYLKLAKGYKEEAFASLLEQFVPLYIQVLKELAEAGANWVQIDEPILGTTLSKKDIAFVKQTYTEINKAVPQINVLLQTYFETVNFYEEIVALPVQGIGLDFTVGDTLSLFQTYGFPEDKVLAAGVIDGRNIWRTNLEEKFTLLEHILLYIDKKQLIVQPSSSLLHVPVSKQLEEALNLVIKDALSFADEKLAEVVALARGLQEGKAAIQKEIEESKRAVQALNDSPYRNDKQTQKNIRNLNHFKASRSLPFAKRIEKQQALFQLPLLPTTTIGSLPQTPEVRRTRLKWRKGEITEQAYAQFIEAETKKWIDMQEEIGLDVLVHGEFERTDMVEYFGEKLNGFEVTRNGWVQSYGSRCVKPPIIFGDVSFDKPMTVKESVYAQSLTKKPVKGMLTGPITILNWSFVRDDILRHEVAYQIALALRKEIENLEGNGIKMVQVDEPALREGLPLDQEKWQDYLDAAVYAFKLATSSVQDDTQIHTHMCYSDFEDIIEAISALDADVISIETSRSHGELISSFEDFTYDKDIGLGVYDIHSPRVPRKEEIIQNIERALQTISPKQFWINPDCGLKTRKEAETVAALKVMVAAAKEIRKAQLALQEK
ncbi:5-methyltetrahydropteroyltriglutamate--homocysteine S-methyltransferase [Bacillus chungangensis]|uniref:5-methyltetrahydropteroyltriglutamate--homocysteine methyltransferase n=1 Tax=Bacillus chungangensis TaxID=587633 RepID=A0ABT9WUV3_9BACI|nr:5-methyltetrahydropteroyltriglutamate--homocysteine S-methyltransferase [Bacillus chungangensis]MDQ0176672.1 5-methyltetrahydropteroyltriglutamate--homocysteine methyltransferase [Bacillus chungangensis]